MNRFIVCADLHIDSRCPRYRKDNYWETVQEKLLWIVATANDRNARLIIAGDIFDSSKCTQKVVNTVIAIFKEAKYVPYVVAGQHDLKFHTDIEETPFFTLISAGVVRLIEGAYEEFTGVGFGQEVPEKHTKFLIIHKSITPDEPPFFLPDAISAVDAFSKYAGYTYIVAGDYHVPFVKQKKSVRMNRYIINCGTMMRNTKDMKNYIPKIFEIDTDANTVSEIEVPHEPFETVFDTEAIEYENTHGIQVDTARLAELMHAQAEEIKLENIVWKVFKSCAYQGKDDLKPLVQEVLNYSTGESNVRK